MGSEVREGRMRSVRVAFERFDKRCKKANQRYYWIFRRHHVKNARRRMKRRAMMWDLLSERRRRLGYS